MAARAGPPLLHRPVTATARQQQPHYHSPTHQRSAYQQHDDDSLTNCCNTCTRVLSSSFGWIGWKAALYPLSFIGFSLFILAVSCLGYFVLPSATTGQGGAVLAPRWLYTPEAAADRLLDQEKEIGAAGFGAESESGGGGSGHGRTVSIVLQHPSLDGRDILTPAYLHALFDVRSAITSVSANYNGQSWTLDDLCIRGSVLGARGRTSANGFNLPSQAFECSGGSPMDAWNNDPATMTSDPSLYTTLLGQVSEANLDKFFVGASGARVRNGDVLSRVYPSVSTASTLDGVTKLPGVMAFRFVLRLQHVPSTTDSSVDPSTAALEIDDERALAWEHALDTALSSLSSYPSASSGAAAQVAQNTTFTNTPFDGFAISILSGAMVSDSSLASARHDRPLLILAFFSGWTMVLLEAFRRNVVRSRAGMSFVVVATTAMAFASGVGMCVGLHVSFHPGLFVLALALFGLCAFDASLLLACIYPLPTSKSRAPPRPFVLEEFEHALRTPFAFIRRSSAAAAGVDGHGRSDDAEDEATTPTRYGYVWSYASQRMMQVPGAEPTLEGGISVGVAAAGPFIASLHLCAALMMLVAAWTDIPAMRSYAFVGCASVIFLLIYQFCFFVPFLVADAHRQNNLRCDAPCCCCAPVDEGVDEEKMCTMSEREVFDESDSSLCGSLIGRPLQRLLFHPVFSILVLLCFVALLCVGIFGCIDAFGSSSSSDGYGHDFDPRLSSASSDVGGAWGAALSPELSTLSLADRSRFGGGLAREPGGLDTSESEKARAAWDALLRFFPDPDEQRTLYLYVLNQALFAKMDELDQMEQVLSTHPFLDSACSSFWWSTYKAWLASTSPYNDPALNTGLISSNGRPLNEAVFASSVEEFLESAPSPGVQHGVQYWMDIMPQDVASSTTPSPSNPLGGGVASMRVKACWARGIIGSVSSGRAALNSLRQTLSTQVTAATGLNVVISTPYEDEYETRSSIHWQVVRSQILSGCVCFILCIMILANLWAAFLLILLMISFMVQWVGLLMLAGQHFASSGISLALAASPAALPMVLPFLLPLLSAFLRATTLKTDVHVAYLTREDRARRTLGQFGGFLVQYACVLFLLGLFFAAASSPSLYNLFVALSLFVVLGVIHGLGVLPILLAWVGPNSLVESDILLAPIADEDLEAVRARPTTLKGGIGGAATVADSSNGRDPANPFSSWRQGQQHAGAHLHAPPAPTSMSMSMHDEHGAASQIEMQSLTGHRMRTSGELG